MLNQERIHYMDSMRAVLMILGIVLHTANIYSPVHTWLISSDNTSPIFGMISSFINLFRMPVFFMISGFFFTYIYLKRQRINIVDRVTRLVVPIIFIALTLNVAQELSLQAYNRNPFDLKHYFANGNWVSHLWFLINLTLYNLLAWVLFKITIVPLFIGRLSTLLTGKYAYLMALIVFPMAVPGIYALNRIFDIYASIYNITNPYMLMLYFQYFAVGLLFGYNRSLLYRFSTPGKQEIFIFALAYSLSFYIKHATTEGTALNDMFDAYNKSLVVLLLSSMCFFIFRRFINQKNQIMILISDSAYTIYLLHHYLVVALGMLFVSLMITPLIAYPTIVLLVFFFTLMAHQIISHSTILKFLLNGRCTRRTHG